MTSSRRLLILALAGLVSGALGASSAAAQGRTAYRGATLETLGPDGRLESATLLVRDGQIEAIGTDVEIPTDARIVSMEGKTILPGIVDPYYVFVEEQPEQDDGDDPRRRFRSRFGRRPVTSGPFRRIADYFYPFETDFRPAVRSGITAANLVARGRGQSAFAWLRPEDGRGMIFEADGLLFCAATNQTEALDVIRNGLDPESGSARRGRGGRRGFAGRGRGGTGGDRGGRSSSGRQEEEETEEPSATEKLWTSIREGKRPLVVNVNNAAAVLHVLKAVEPYPDVRLAIVGSGPNLYEPLDLLEGKKVSLILQPTIDEVPYTSKRMCLAKMAHERQIPFVLSLSLDRTQMTRSQDDPLFPIAVLVKNGLPREAALKALTSEPARLLGIDEKVGTLEKGKVANLLIFDGDPLSLGSRLEKVLVEGSPVHEQ